MKAKTEGYLQALNQRLITLHTRYEDYYWTSYMGDHSFDEKMNAASAELDAFRSDECLSAQIDEALESADGETRERLLQWKKFFSCYQAPPDSVAIKARISKIEASVVKKRSEVEEGYIEPKSGAFVEASFG